MMDANTTTKVSVTDDEVSMALGAALSRFAFIKGRVEATEDSVAIRGTAELPIPGTFLGRYVYIEAIVAPSDSELAVSSFSIGTIPIPSWIIKPVMVYALDGFMGKGKGEPAYASIRSVAVTGNLITVAYPALQRDGASLRAWPPSISAQENVIIGE